MYTAAAQIEGAGGRARPVVGDIRDEDQVAAAVALAVERFGGIDVCVSAGIGLFGYQESMTVPDAETSLAVEFTGAAVLAAAAAIALAAPLLRRRS